MRDFAKLILQNTGVFPIARHVFRKLNPKIRAQLHKELQFYKSILPQNGLCFDVGANLGQRSEIFLKLNQRAIVIEPNVHCRPALVRLFGSNPKVDLVFQAVGVTEGSIDLYSHGTDSTASVLPGWDSEVFGRDRGLAKLPVPMTTLDALIERYGIPDFVKIDVEGFEAEVLRGLSQKLPLISFEYHARRLDKMRECLSLLHRHGKCIFRASTMECDWVTEPTDDADICLGEIETACANGDIFVWTT